MSNVENVSIRARPIGRAILEAFDALIDFAMFQSAPDQLAGRFQPGD